MRTPTLLHPINMSRMLPARAASGRDILEHISSLTCCIFDTLCAGESSTEQGRRAQIEGESPTEEEQTAQTGADLPGVEGRDPTASNYTSNVSDPSTVDIAKVQMPSCARAAWWRARATSLTLDPCRHAGAP